MEEDLTWLVRETKGEWFGNSTYIARDGLEHYLWARKSVEEIVHRYPGYHWFTQAEYLARTAELQNKPSWSDAPEWAPWMAQHRSGFWCWGCGMELPCGSNAGSGTWSSANGKCEWSGCAGDVIGDWRDTLERRPSDMSAPVVAEQVEGATWFERGELPPVGIECEYVSPISSAVKAAFIVAKHHFSEQVIWSTRQSGGELFYGQKGCFRPIRTERDELMDIIRSSAHPLDGVDVRLAQDTLADAILAAGFKRDGGAA